MKIDPCSLGPYLMSVLVSYTKIVIDGMNMKKML